MPTQVERRTTTRAALLAAARELFTEKGFAATGREEIAERAGVTRGALYHHFASKQDAFAAVASELDAELAERVVTAARHAESAYEQIRVSARAYVEACAEPAVMRILLTEAAAVLGPQWVRASQEAACVALLTPALEAAARAGFVVPGDVHIAAQLLLGLLNEAGSIIAAAPNPKATLRRVLPTVDALVARFLGAAGEAGVVGTTSGPRRRHLI
jgi:AcrR family transcriptional regulator